MLVITSVLDAPGADRLAAGMAGLALRHVPVLVNLEDPGLVAHARSRPDSPEGAAAKVAAMAMQDRLDALATRLRGRGVEVLTSPADRLALGLVEAYSGRPRASQLSAGLGTPKNSVQEARRMSIRSQVGTMVRPWSGLPPCTRRRRTPICR